MDSSNRSTSNQELLSLQKKIAFLEHDNKDLMLQKANLQETLAINKQILNGVLAGVMTNDEDILGQLQEESDILIGEIQRMQSERDELASKVLVLEQINYDQTAKQLEQSDAMDKTITDLQQQLNVMQFVADSRERYLDDAISTA